MPEPHDIRYHVRPVSFCATCGCDIFGTPTFINGRPTCLNCRDAHYEAATDADYDALYEPTDGGEA